jgi:hypothetical protein
MVVYTMLSLTTPYPYHILWGYQIVQHNKHKCYTRIRDRQRHWGGHFEGSDSFSAAQELASEAQQCPETSRVPATPASHTSHILSSTPSHPPALLGSALSLSRPLQMPCYHFNKGKLQN